MNNNEVLNINDSNNAEQHNMEQELQYEHLKKLNKKLSSFKKRQSIGKKEEKIEQIRRR